MHALTSERMWVVTSTLIALSIDDRDSLPSAFTTYLWGWGADDRVETSSATS